MTNVEIYLWKTLFWFLGEILAHASQGRMGSLPRDRAQEAIDLLGEKTSFLERD